jgi:Uma2 family endonuclease
MAHPAHKPTITDYLAWENDQPERHEFYRGEIFAMVGARRVHGLIGLNLGAALKLHLKGSPCRAFVEGMKVQVADDAVFYPDVFATCDVRDLRTEMIFRHPKLIIEVLSESTQAYDRGLKFAAYRALDSLLEYVMVDPDTRRVEVYRRNERGLFELHDQTGREAVEFACVGFTLPMAEVFDGIEDTPAA